MVERARQIGELLAAAADCARRPLVMGILNVTPDSFADGGRFAAPDAAIAHGRKMRQQGADLIDVGGESTRPGAAPVPVRLELDRVLPVVRALAGDGGVPVSIDTRRAEVAEAALAAGAVMVNDVSGFRHDPEMPHLLGRERPLAVAMHMRGGPGDMATRTHYCSLVADCVTELWASAQTALEAGLPIEHLFLDPGIGFAKDAAQNLALMANLDLFARLGRPLVVGVSRKAFLGHVTGQRDPSDRLFATAAAVAVAVLKGARVLRVHDVPEMVDVVGMAHAILAAGARGDA